MSDEATRRRSDTPATPQGVAAGGARKSGRGSRRNRPLRGGRTHVQLLGAWLALTVGVAVLGLGGVLPEVVALVHVMSVVGLLLAVTLPDAALAQARVVGELALGFGVLLAAVLVGLVPLPRGALAALSPGVVAARPEDPWWTLSLRPEATLDEAAFHVSLLSIATLAGAWGAARWRRSEVERAVLAGMVVLLGVAGLHVASGSTSLFGLVPTSLVIPGSFLAPFVDRNHFGFAMALGMPVAAGALAREERRSSTWWAAMALLVLGGWCILHAQARGAALGLAVGALAAAAVQVRSEGAAAGARWARALALVAVPATGALVAWRWYDGADDSLAGRVAIWKSALVAWGGSRWTGVGGGASEAAVAPFRTDMRFVAWDHLHNDPLEWVVETGVLGLLAAVVAAVLLRPRRSEEGTRAVALSAAVLAILVGSAFEFPLQMPGLALATVAILALRRAVFEERRPIGPRAARAVLASALAFELVATAWTARAAVEARAISRAMAWDQDRASAVVAADRLRTVAPWRAEIALVDGWEALASEERERAAALARTLVANHPDDADTLRRAALILAKAGALPDARAALERSTGRAPSDWRSAVGRAKVLQVAGEDAEAAWVDAFRRGAPAAYLPDALAVVPVGLFWLDVFRDLPAPYSARLGALSAEQRDWEVALLAYEQAAMIDPAQFGAYPPMGRALLEVGDVVDAEAFARRGLEGAPGDPRLLELLGQALVARGAWDEAAEAFLEAGEERPGARIQAVRAVARGGGPEAADRLVRRLELVGQDDPATQLEVARVRQEAGDLSGCAAQVRRGALTEDVHVGQAAQRLLTLCEPRR